MQAAARLDLMLKALKTKQSLTLRDVMTLTGASRDTARRDIIKLTATGAANRNYGGLSLPNRFSRIDDYLTRQADQPTTKRQLGQLAATLASGKQRLFLDVSTTIGVIPQYLKVTAETLTVTNSIDIADQLLRQTPGQMRLLGGRYEAARRGTMDSAALHDLFGFQFDLTFLSAAGLTANGLFFAYQDDVPFKQQLRAQSQTLVLVLDHTRLGVTHNYRGLTLDQIDYLVTDAPIESSLKQALETADVSILYSTTN
ncbi:DeoR/GlpR family DNA-binding transcription regulator [Lactiplantibacillus daowaiensis]|uniref:DeoR/GlpR family DNA-binding transcription regulator n=1 Tax=Lactiplantibacillus daowaiensis TaxID=2559918 RepID=A0ABW1S034_9LACO|nr:DeoR/GlpR family DNA-binding transcription regulator [Lactiplantibacillus daowaiensis]